jgi:choline dehydrogenase-like flavoprotein
MTRAALFVLVLAGLGASGHTLWAKRFQPHRGGSVQLVHGRRLAFIELRAARRMESRAKALVGTYSETEMHVFQHLRVVYANETVYCLEVKRDGSTFHLEGPGGKPADGPC